MIKSALKAAPVFSDNMVLQYGKPAAVWGYGHDGNTVRVIFNNTFLTETKVCNGQWNLLLPPLDAGLQGDLVITDDTEEIRFKNIITGDVWFAGGQSNMEMELENCNNGMEELSACTNPGIRFYHVVKRAVVDADYLREENESSWQICAPDTAGGLSAAAFFFARKINKETGIPIGIINCSWGGTSIAAWMSIEQLEKSKAGRRFIDDYAAKIGGKTDEQYNAEMNDYFAAWQKWDTSVRIMREKNPDVTWDIINKECGACPWPQPAGRTSPYAPSNLHTARIRRVAPFTIKGFIYYQGEEDIERAADYREMMYYLVRQWREDWNDNKLPFFFVQLPMYSTREEIEADPSAQNWCLMRESQYSASLDISNTGLAVIIDCGELDNIHPLDKQTVGCRLALQALKKVYGKDIEADSPAPSRIELHKFTQEETGLRIHFDNAESGLMFRDNNPNSFNSDVCFEIAGDDGVFYPAKAMIEVKTVIVFSDKVLNPKSVRYAWRNYCPTPMYAKNGLPAMPFRAHLTH